MRQLKISKQITNRESQSLDKYLQEIGKVSLVTIDEEVDLAQRIREGDQMALEKLTKANLRFVVSVSKQYQNQGLTLGDLINEGNLGLIKAAKRFDETKGFKFISYAVWWIRQSILQALAEQSRIVRLPLNRVGSLNKISRSFAELEQQFEREPSPDEIAELLDLSTSEVVDTLKVSGRHVSMDAPFANGEENGLLDVLQDEGQATPDAGLLHESLRREVAGARDADPAGGRRRDAALRAQWARSTDVGRDWRAIQLNPRTGAAGQGEGHSPSPAHLALAVAQVIPGLVSCPFCAAVGFCCVRLANLTRPFKCAKC
jgi:RNA polymerase primary sigma factor